VAGVTSVAGVAGVADVAGEGKCIYVFWCRGNLKERGYLEDFAIDSRKSMSYSQGMA
jgi:hypothetical protein